MIINYYQPADPSRDGVLVLEGEIHRTTGRLDAVGSRVFADGFQWTHAVHGPLRLLVQCERVSETQLAVDLSAFGLSGQVFFTHRVSGIPLAVT